MKKSTFSFILILIFAIFSSVNPFPFQKKIWIFWHDQDFAKAPLLAQLCAQKIKISAEKAGFEFILLNQHTVKNYINNYDQRITKVRERSYQKGLMFLADLIRFHIIHQHGGIWMDITEILIDDFNWLLNIQDDKYKHLIANRFSEEPDVLLFYFEGYQNAAQYYIHSPIHKNQTILYNQIPGYEIWFLAAKKHSTLMGQIKNTYVRFTQIPFSEIQSIFEKQDIYMNNEDVDGYLTANLAISYVLQRKQFQLDKQFFISSQNRYNVYQYYNLWSLSGLLGPLTWTNGDKFKIQHLLDKPKDYFEQKGSVFYFMVKLVGWTKNVIGQRIQMLQKLFQQKQFTIQKFIQSKPTRFQCQQINFLFNGSVLYPIFQDSFYLNNHTIRAITQQENEMWVQYCSQNYFDYEWRIIPSFINFFMLFSLDSLKIPWSRTHRTVNFNKKYDDFISKVNDFLVEESCSIQFFSSLLANFTISFLLCLLLISYCLKKINHNKIYNEGYKQKHLYGGNQSQLKNYQQKNDNLKQKIMVSVSLIGVWTLSLFLFFYIDFFGYRDQQFTTLFGVIIVTILQNFIENHISKFKSLKILYEISYLYLNYWIVYISFSQTKKNKVWLVYCAFEISLLGPRVLRLSQRIRTQNFILKNFILFSKKGIFRYCLIGFVAIMTIFPKIRYITYDQSYIVSFIIWIPAIVIGMLYILALIECIKTKVNVQIFRTVTIGFLTLYLYFIAPYRNQVNGFNLQRIHWGFIVVAIFQTFSIQIGKSFNRKEVNGIKQSTQGYKKNQWQSLLVLFLVVFLEIFLGSFSHLWRIFDFGKLIIIEHLILVGNILFICLYGEINGFTKNQQMRQFETQTALEISEIVKNKHINNNFFSELMQVDQSELTND